MPHPAGMFVVTEAEAAAIRVVFEQRGEHMSPCGCASCPEAVPLRLRRAPASPSICSTALQAVIITKLGCHTFRATGITVYLLNGGLLEYAQQMAAHESARTTKLYDRRNDQVTLDQVARIVL